MEVNPDRKSKEDPLRWLDGYCVILLVTPAVKLVPNVAFYTPLAYTSEAEAGILTHGQPRTSIFPALACGQVIPKT